MSIPRSEPAFSANAERFGLETLTSPEVFRSGRSGERPWAWLALGLRPGAHTGWIRIGRRHAAGGPSTLLRVDLDQRYHQDDADTQAAYLASRVNLLDRLLWQQALYQRIVRDATTLPIVTEWRDQAGHPRTHVISAAFLFGHRSLIRSLTRDLLDLGDDGLAQLRRIQERHAADDGSGS